MNRLEAQTILHLDATFSKNTLKIAYRRCASESHPDKGGTNNEMKKVNEAYNILHTFTIRVPKNKQPKCNMKEFLFKKLEVSQNKEGNWCIPLKYNKHLIIFSITLFNERTWVISNLMNGIHQIPLYSFFKELPETETTCNALIAIQNETNVENIINIVEGL